MPMTFLLGYLPLIECRRRQKTSFTHLHPTQHQRQKKMRKMKMNPLRKDLHSLMVPLWHQNTKDSLLKLDFLVLLEHLLQSLFFTRVVCQNLYQQARFEKDRCMLDFELLLPKDSFEFPYYTGNFGKWDILVCFKSIQLHVSV